MISKVLEEEYKKGNYVVIVEGIDTKFEYSDHNPVKTTIKLK